MQRSKRRYSNMSDMMIRGESILAMVNDNTSVEQMLTTMGVQPTEDLVNEAVTEFSLNGDTITMESLYNFLKEKKILSKKHLVNNKLASVVDLR
jgi:hypothetical protein